MEDNPLDLEVLPLRPEHVARACPNRKCLLMTNHFGDCVALADVSNEGRHSPSPSGR